MLKQIFCAVLIGIAAWVPVHAQTPAPQPPGQISAGRVRGQVTAKNTVTGDTRVVHDADAVSEHTIVTTGPGGSVVLIFSNGATVSVAADSQLDIDQFVQDPFSGTVRVAQMKEEPTTSHTKLNLIRGELVGKVAHLNIDRGSEFTVQTPVGAAGIRGTIWRITFRPAGNGKAFFSLSTSEGLVSFKPVSSAAALPLPAGKQIVVVNIDIPAPTAGGTTTTPATTPTTTPTATTTPATPATVTVEFVATNIPAVEAAQIQAVTQAIIAAVQTTTFTITPVTTPSPNAGSNKGTTTSTVTPDTSPSQPVVPLQQTTPGAGGP